MAEVVTKNQSKAMGQRVLQMFSDALNAIADDFENLPHPIIRVFSVTGSTVTATSNDGATTVTATESNGIWEFKIPSFGYWTVKSVKGSTTYTREVYVNEIKKYHAALGVEVKRYGYRIKEAEPDPYERVEYIYDAVGMTPAHMDFENDTFDYGSWADVWFVKDNKPLMLKSDGTVDYYLDPNDYTKKENGDTDTDVANADYDGNAMAQFPLCWIYRYEDDTYKYEIVSNVQYDEEYKAYAHTRSDGSIADYIFFSMFVTSNISNKLRSISDIRPNNFTYSNGLSNVKNNGDYWEAFSFSQYNLLRALIILLGKTCNVQSFLGIGNCRGVGSSASNQSLSTGTLKDKGGFFGYNVNNKQVKAFHIEAVWGDRWIYCPGINQRRTDRHVFVKMTPEGTGYTLDNLIGYKDLGSFTSSTNIAYISNCSYNEYGVFPTSSSNGSDSTYYCDIYQASIDTTYNTYILVFNASYINNSSYGGVFSCVFTQRNDTNQNWTSMCIACFQPKTVEA